MDRTRLWLQARDVLVALHATEGTLVQNCQHSRSLGFVLHIEKDMTNNPHIIKYLYDRLLGVAIDPSLIGSALVQFNTQTLQITHVLDHHV